MLAAGWLAADGIVGIDLGDGLVWEVFLDVDSEVLGFTAADPLGLLFAADALLEVDWSPFRAD